VPDRSILHGATDNIGNDSKQSRHNGVGDRDCCQPSQLGTLKYGRDLVLSKGLVLNTIAGLKY
jgi:hypothetical protein